MNRIRNNNNVFQVLLTPTQPTNAGFELIRGDMVSFDDSYLRDYKILSYDTLGAAQDIAFNYPDIDWDGLVLLHNNVYIDLKRLIEKDLRQYKISADFEPHMMNAVELKETMFNRVENAGDRFNLSYQLNDIISFTIVNMWTANLDLITSILVNDRRLRIKKVQKIGPMIKLIGITDVSTAYEIRLIPTVISQYLKWIQRYNITSEKAKKIMLERAEKQQKEIDNNFVIR